MKKKVLFSLGFAAIIGAISINFSESDIVSDLVSLTSINDNARANDTSSDDNSSWRGKETTQQCPGTFSTTEYEWVSCSANVYSTMLKRGIPVKCEGGTYYYCSRTTHRQGKLTHEVCVTGFGLCWSESCPNK